MKRSEINQIHHQAQVCFERHGWALPPEPKWDITDFGLGQFDRFGLVLINLAEEPEYCEKLMFARPDQRTPAHTHAQKKEDIICRHGRLALQLWNKHPDLSQQGSPFPLRVNGVEKRHRAGEILILQAGERITLTPGIYHEFWPESEDCIIGEVSTANDDAQDNFFVDPGVGRFPGIEEDEPASVELINDHTGPL